MGRLAALGIIVFIASTCAAPAPQYAVLPPDLLSNYYPFPFPEPRPQYPDIIPDPYLQWPPCPDAWPRPDPALWLLPSPYFPPDVNIPDFQEDDTALANFCGSGPIKVFVPRDDEAGLLVNAGFRSVNVPGGMFFINQHPDVIIQSPPILVRPPPLCPIIPPAINVRLPQIPPITPPPIIVNPELVCPVDPPVVVEPLCVPPPCAPHINPAPISACLPYVKSPTLFYRNY